MNLSRNQKRYAGILGACALALVVDRLFLAPGEAEAGETERPATTGTAAPPVVRDPLPIPAIPEKPLADRFSALAEERMIDVAGIADPFQVPAEWLPDEPGGTAQIVESDDPAVEDFRQAHRLNAVMALETGGYAIVDGRRLRLGQEIDGFELVEIRPRSIVLRSDVHGHVELSLLDAGRPGGAGQPIRRPQ